MYNYSIGNISDKKFFKELNEDFLILRNAKTFEDIRNFISKNNNKIYNNVKKTPLSYNRLKANDHISTDFSAFEFPSFPKKPIEEKKISLKKKIFIKTIFN